jgi:hypothetical protein
LFIEKDFVTGFCNSYHRLLRIYPELVSGLTSGFYNSVGHIVHSSLHHVPNNHNDFALSFQYFDYAQYRLRRNLPKALILKSEILRLHNYPEQDALYIGITNNLEQRLIEHFLEKGKEKPMQENTIAITLYFSKNISM